MLLAALVGVPAAAVMVPSDAQASVSIAVEFDALVKDADAVGVVTPVEQKSVWEDGKIWTYTKVKVDQNVAGDAATGSDGWVRTMGGVVGKIGQMVDGEAVFVTGKPSLLFLHKYKQGGTFHVSARAQGQFPVTVNETTKAKRIIRSSSMGVLYPPKAKVADAAQGTSGAGDVKTQSQSVDPRLTEAPKLAGDILHDRPLDEAARDIASAWKRLHPTAGATDTKK